LRNSAPAARDARAGLLAMSSSHSTQDLIAKSGVRSRIDHEWKKELEKNSANAQPGREAGAWGGGTGNLIDLLAIFPVLGIPAPGFSRNTREFYALHIESDWIL
jgi:hypothetical protein